MPPESVSGTLSVRFSSIGEAKRTLPGAGANESGPGSFGSVRFLAEAARLRAARTVSAKRWVTVSSSSVKVLGRGEETSIRPNDFFRERIGACRGEARY